VRRVYSSQLVKSVPELMAATADSPDYTRNIEYRLVYRNQIEFRNFAKKLGLMDDFKVNVQTYFVMLMHVLIFYLNYRLEFQELRIEE